ncbi:hypothetical protein [Streptomyces boninensis]|uniref:hypothetical protein n=1 Tax=Streptomyces boninensis TaxID=2039455 RepID=UPI003B21B47F
MTRRIPEAEARAVMRASGLNPQVPYPGAGKPWECLCIRCGETVSPTLSNVKAGKGCVRCRGIAQAARYAAARAERLEEARAAAASRPPKSRLRLDPGEAVAVMRSVGLEPLEDYPGATTRWRCRCRSCGDEVLGLLNSAKTSGSGCPRCARKQAAAKRRISAADAEAIMRAAGLTPQTDYPGSKQPWPCVCDTCGEPVSPTLSAIRAGKGCRFCAITASAAARTGKPRTTAPNKRGPEQAKADLDAAGFDPLEDYPGAGNPWRAIHRPCGREVAPRLSHIRGGRKGCPHCGRKDAAAALRLSDEEAAARLKAAGFSTTAPYPGTNKPWPSTCDTCGKPCSPTLSSVAAGKGCPHCANLSRSATKRHDAAECEAEMLRFGYRTLTDYPGVITGWTSIHLACGNEVTPRLNDLRNGAGGCRWCAPWGFKYDGASAARIYVLHHPALHATKVGVATTDNRTSRTDAFARYGWHTVEALPVGNGALAHAVEQAVHERLAAEGHANGHLKPHDMGGIGGHTETYDAGRLTPQAAWEIVREVHARLTR